MQRALLVTAALLSVATIDCSSAGPSTKEIHDACYGAAGPQEGCTLLIAQSIVANAKSCLAQSRSDAADGAGNGLQSDYESCVSNFCYRQCASHTDCTDLCVEKGRGLLDKLMPAAPTLLQLSGSTSSAAMAAAQAWLHAIDAPPQGDELAELKDANPEAYGIVKALLVKQQLGLLNPRHPSASMSAEAPPTVSAEDRASLTRMEEEVKTRSSQPEEAPEASAASSAPYPEVGAANHDWLSWKPQSSDEQMVQSVLGAVSQLKGGTPAMEGSLLSQHSDTAGSLAAQASALGFDATPGDSAPQAAPAVDSAPPVVATPAVDSAPAAVTPPAADSAPTMADSMAAVPQAATQPAPAKKASGFWGSLFSGVAERKQVSQQAMSTEPVAAAGSPTNPYLQSINWQPDATPSSAGGANPYLSSTGFGSAPQAPPPVHGSFMTQGKKVQQSVSPYLDAIAELR